MNSKIKLLEKQKKLLGKLTKVEPFMAGSLYTVKRICGNKNCRCRRSPSKKHPAMFLTWKEKKKTKTIYVPVSMKKEAELWSENYSKLKTLLRLISDIQKQLLKLR